MEKAGNIYDKCNVASSRIKAVTLRACLTRRILDCHYTCGTWS